MSVEEIARYWKRKGMSIDDIMGTVREAVLQGTMAPSTLIPASVAPPPTLVTIKSTFHSIREYILDGPPAFEDGMLLLNLERQIVSACDLFDIGWNEKAGDILRNAFVDIENVLRLGRSLNLGQIVGASLKFLHRGKFELSSTMLRHSVIMVGT